MMFPHVDKKCLVKYQTPFRILKPCKSKFLSIFSCISFKF
jgi:hypothetical protein